MSLINKMLQDLDERRPEGTTGPVFHAQIRAVPERAGVIHPAWWVVIPLAVVIAWIGTWLWMHQSSLNANAVPPLILQAQLPLKLAPALTMRVPGVEDTDVVRSQPASTAEASGANESAMRNENILVAQKNADRIGKPGAVGSNSIQESVSAERLQLSASTGIGSAASPAVKIRPDSIQKEQPSSVPVAVATKDTDVKTPMADTQAEETSPMPVKHVSELTPQQRAENEYRNAATLMQQSRSVEAAAALEQALVLDPKHAAARQLLVGLLLDSKRPDEAIRWAREGLTLDPSQTGLAMILARMQIDRGELDPALATLMRSVSYATDRADYQAFLGALLQRAERHKEAVSHYVIAVRKAPQNGIWWMGLGISLQAENRGAEALEAFGRAKTSGSLSPELQAFVEQRLSQLQR